MVYSSTRGAWIPQDATKMSNQIPYAALVSLPATTLLGNGQTSTHAPVAVTIGSGLSLSTGNVLSATGSGGTVTSVSVVTANGVSGSVANATTTPAITLTLGNITPTSVTATGTVTGSNLSGTNTGDQTSVSGNAGTATAIAGGSANQIPFQQGASNTQFISAVNNAVLVTNSSGVPSESTTLPSGLTIPGALQHVTTGISAAGSNQSTATAITDDINVIGTVGSGQGVRLPTASVGMTKIVENQGANTLLVYPASGGQIDAAGANVAISLPVGYMIQFVATSTTQWFSSLKIIVNTSALQGTISNAQLANNKTYLGTTSLTLGDASGSNTTLAGMSSITSTSFVGALTGNASTATTLQTARTINGVSFNGSTNITITAASPNALSFGNGFVTTTAYDGSAARTLTLGTPTSVGSGSSNTVTATSHTHAVSLNSSDVTGGLGYTPVNKAGDTLTGALILAADPVTALGAATKQYVDNAIQSTSAGISAKQSVVAVSTSNISTLSGTLTVDGQSITAGQRILLTGQTTASQNGPWIVASGAWSRPTTDANNELETGSLWFVERGTVNGATQWWLNSPTAGTTITPGTTAIGIVQFAAAQIYTASGTGGLQLAGNAFSVLTPAGGGIVADATGTHIDTSVVVRKYVNTTVGNGSSTSITLTHNLGTQAINCSLINNSTLDIEDVCFNAATANTVILTFGAAPASNAYTVVVMG